MVTPIDAVLFKRRKKFFRREIGDIVLYLPQQKFVFFSYRCYCADRTQNLPGQPPTLGLRYSKVHPNRSTFGGVIAERVKAVLLAHRVFAILGFRRKIIN